MTNTYWHDEGKEQKLYDSIWKNDVPVSCECETVKGELVRIIGHIQYEYFNNGNINSCKTIYEDVEYEEVINVLNEETGEWEDEIETYYESECVDTDVEDYYASMLKYVNEHVPNIKPFTNKIIDIICANLYGNYTKLFSDKNTKDYSDWAEEIMKYVKTL